MCKLIAVYVKFSHFKITFYMNSSAISMTGFDVFVACRIKSDANYNLKSELSSQSAHTEMHL